MLSQRKREIVIACYGSCMPREIAIRFGFSMRQVETVLQWAHHNGLIRRGNHYRHFPKWRRPSRLGKIVEELQACGSRF